MRGTGAWELAGWFVEGAVACACACACGDINAPPALVALVKFGVQLCEGGLAGSLSIAHLSRYSLLGTSHYPPTTLPLPSPIMPAGGLNEARARTSDSANAPQHTQRPTGQGAVRVGRRS
jgi:hypothetical protein